MKTTFILNFFLFLKQILLHNLQKGILKLVNNNKFVSDNSLNISQLFAFVSLKFHFNN